LYNVEINKDPTEKEKVDPVGVGALAGGRRGRGFESMKEEVLRGGAAIQYE